MKTTTLALLLTGCLPGPVEWLPAPVPEQGPTMTLAPSSGVGSLVDLRRFDDIEGVPAQADTGGDDTGTAPTDTGGSVDTASDGGTDTGGSDTGEPEDTAPEDPCAGKGYIDADLVGHYGSPGGGEVANLGDLDGVGYLCSWSCDGSPWWITPTVGIDGDCDGGKLPMDVGASGPVELCVEVETTGTTSYATCRAVYTGGETAVAIGTG